MVKVVMGLGGLMWVLVMGLGGLMWVCRLWVISRDGNALLVFPFQLCKYTLVRVEKNY